MDHRLPGGAGPRLARVETGLVAHPAPGRPRSLADSLRAWDEDALTALLMARPDLLRPTPKDLAALAARATSGPSTSRCLDQLARLDLHLLGTLVHDRAGSRTSAADLVNQTASTVPCAPADGGELLAAVQACLERVRSLALVWGPDDDLRATHAVRDALGVAPRPNWPPPGLEIGSPVTGCDAEGGWQAIGCLARIQDLLDEWGLHPPGVLRTGGLGVREFAAARAVMHADLAPAALAIEIAHAAGLVTSDDEASPCYLPTDSYDDWLELAPGKAWAVLAEAWLRLPRLPSLAGERANLLSADLDRRAVIAMRRQVLDLLARAPDHCPVSTSSLAAVLDDRHPRGSGPLRQQVIQATLVEGTILGVIAAGALTTAGRVLATGSGALGPAMAKTLPDLVDHVLVQADLTIIAPGPLPAQLQRTLAKLADIESTGHARVYRLSPSSLGRALEAGLDGPAVRDQLAEISRSPLPDTVTSLIEDVARRHGGVRVGLAQSYVRCVDAASAAAIAVDRSLQHLGLSRVDDHLLVSSAPANALLPALRAAGYPVAGETAEGSILMPRLESHRTAATGHQVRVHRAGTGSVQVSVQAAVRALRSAESAIAQQAQSVTGGADEFAGIEVDAARRCSGPAALALLRAAIADSQSVSMSYAEDDGVDADRLLDPIRLGGGSLTAFDHRAGQVRTFTLARVSSVAPILAQREGEAGHD